jgi:hypothetical protein
MSHFGRQSSEGHALSRHCPDFTMLNPIANTQAMRGRSTWLAIICGRFFAN